MKRLKQHLNLTGEQEARLRAFEALAVEFNRKVNLYSQASVGAFWERHVWHSLTLGLRRFPPGARVVDWGSGGGLPGIPLAIAFPETEFVLVDSVGKKTRAVQAMARRLGLENVEVWHGRAEGWEGAAHYGVSRATAPLREVWAWTQRVLAPVEAGKAEWEGGLLCLKGRVQEVEDAIKTGLTGSSKIEVHDLSPWVAGGLEEKLLVEVVAGNRTGQPPEEATPSSRRQGSGQNL